MEPNLPLTKTTLTLNLDIPVKYFQDTQMISVACMGRDGSNRDGSS